MKNHFCLILCLFLLLQTASCAPGVNAADLSKGVNPGTVNSKETDALFTENMAEFSINLFKKTINEDKNSLISPLSVMLALSMTANGAEGETLKEMEALLGKGIALSDLNEYLYTYVKNLPNEDKSKLEIANSIWFRDDDDRLKVEQSFLQTNADYYGANAYKAPFDNGTKNDINNWVKDKTDGMIDKIIDKIDRDTVMYLINALVFDAEWQKVYYKSDLSDGTFTAKDGTKQNVEFMRSTEGKYLDDGKAVGFLKSYAGGHYSFAALLPEESISIDSYIESLTGEGWLKLIKNAENNTVYASMPKFSYEYDIKMSGALKNLGIPIAFDPENADFSGMAAYYENDNKGIVYISEVLHKTFISVDELGTKARAVTVVAMPGDSAPMDPKTVRLDRPFVFAIVDNTTDLPVFLGTLLSVK